MVVFRDIMFLHGSEPVRPAPFRLVRTHYLASFPGLLCPPLTQQVIPLLRLVEQKTEIFPGVITGIETRSVASKVVVIFDPQAIATDELNVALFVRRQWSLLPRVMLSQMVRFELIVGGGVEPASCRIACG